MAKKKKREELLLWEGVEESDFIDESENIVDEDIADYDKIAMTYFIQNVNLMRHFPKLADSLKPVERRGLYTLYTLKSLPGTKPKKSGVTVGDTMTFHPHGDGSIYGTLVGMAQPFINPVPLIHGIGNYGNDAHPKGYAAMRYTEMTMSKYAMDCFFSDYDDDCVEKIFNTSRDEDEPLVLPCKYPNILVNGGFGIAVGNAYCVPTYPIPDIVRLIKRLLKNPDADNIYMMPDVPTGCDVVDNGLLREICDTGKGTLKMRSTITVEENPKKPSVWILRVHNLPWMIGISSIKSRLADLTKSGILPIKDIEDHSYTVKTKDPNGGDMARKIIQLDILVNKAHDPNQIIAKLYKLTTLQHSVSVDFKVVTDTLTVDRMDMRNLALSWINIRREYLRRLVNKKISKLTARLAILDILIELTSKDNLDKTIKIIRSNDEKDTIKALTQMKGIKINTFQAEKIADSKLRAFSKDAHKKYKDEYEKVSESLKTYMDMTKSSKTIDEKIAADMDDLLKYHVDRGTTIVAESNAAEIPDTDHFLAISKQGMIKKLPYIEGQFLKKKSPSLGAFKNHDYPTTAFQINNHDSVMLFDNFGRYSCIPVHTIENTEPSQYGSRVFDVTKLNGEIVNAFPFFADNLQSFIKEMIGKPYIVTLTKNGYLKKTAMEEFTSTRNQKNVRAMNVRADDQMICGVIVIERENVGTNMMIYTERGRFAYIHSDEVAMQSKGSSGLLSIKLDPDDACKGICIIGDTDTHLLIITEKGNMKRCELDYLGQPGKRKLSSYLATVDSTDAIYMVESIADDAQIGVGTRTSYQVYNADDIPVRSRKSKCAKMVPVPLGSNIIFTKVMYPSKGK